jgi:hypothetical protein
MEDNLNSVQRTFINKFEGEARERALAFMLDKNRRWELFLIAPVTLYLQINEAIMHNSTTTVARIVEWRKDSELSCRYWEAILPNGIRVCRSTIFMETGLWAEQAQADKELDAKIRDSFG